MSLGDGDLGGIGLGIDGRHLSTPECHLSGETLGCSLGPDSLGRESVLGSEVSLTTEELE